MWLGEAAGASELVQRAVIALSHAWSLRGPQTSLAQTFIEFAGANDLPDLLEGLVNERYFLHPGAAPLVFQAAQAGDGVAQELVRWAGCELAEMGKAVIRQLDLQTLDFDVVLIGSMFNAGSLLIEPMQASLRSFAPGARFVRLPAPPVIGGVLLAMEIVNQRTPAARQQLLRFNELIVE